MPNKRKNRWLDVQLVLASLAVTSTVAVWNVLARGSRPAGAAPTAAPVNPAFTLTYTPSPTAMATESLPAAEAAPAQATADGNAPIQLPKVHLLLGGGMPVAPVVVAAAPASGNSQGSASKSSAGVSQPAPAPAPVTNTQSSKP